MTRRWLLVPSTVKGNGSGHLVRCLGLARLHLAAGKLPQPGPGGAGRPARHQDAPFPADHRRHHVRPPHSRSSAVRAPPLEST